MKKIIAYVIATIAGLCQFVLLICGVLYLESLDIHIPYLKFLIENEASGLLVLISFIWPALVYLAANNSVKELRKYKTKIQSARRNSEEFAKLYNELIKKKQ